MILRTCLVAWLFVSGGVAMAHSLDSHAKPTVPGVCDEWVTRIEELIVPAADAMPEGKYSFAPTQGNFTGVRTFAEQIKHLAAANYQLGARILGEPPPEGTRNETAPDSVRSKAEIMEYLKGSFACLHRAARTIDEINQVEPLQGITGRQQRTRLGSLIDALAHASNHYGQMVEYLRMNGIIPPESRDAKLVVAFRMAGSF